MKKLIFIVSATLCVGLLKAQSISSSVMSASGSSFEAENFTLHFSIGEPLNTLIEEGDLMISQGVLQIILNKITPVEESTISNILKIYPNPTADMVQINIVDFSKKYDYELYNMNGALLHEAPLSKTSTSFNMAHLPKASYLLKILENDKLYKNIKLIKQ